MSEAIDEAAMRLAIDQARNAWLVGEVPVGAVILRDGQVLATGYNRPITTHDPTAHAEMLAAQGQHLKRGVLLFGPPGTGKTQIARTLANKAKCNFIAASTADLKAGFVGQSGQRVKALFDSARAQAPTILFLDEIDALAADRSAADSFVQEAVTQLLQEDPTISLLVLATAVGSNPGPLVTHLMSNIGRGIRIPVTLVPGQALSKQTAKRSSSSRAMQNG